MSSPMEPATTLRNVAERDFSRKGSQFMQDIESLNDSAVAEEEGVFKPRSVSFLQLLAVEAVASGSIAKRDA